MDGKNDVKTCATDESCQSMVLLLLHEISNPDILTFLSKVSIEEEVEST